MSSAKFVGMPITLPRALDKVRSLIANGDHTRICRETKKADPGRGRPVWEVEWVLLGVADQIGVAFAGRGDAIGLRTVVLDEEIFDVGCRLESEICSKSMKP